ncbi:MAG: Hpt domain-containing protein [Rhodoferax sp.]
MDNPAPTPAENNNPMRKIILMIGVAIVVFLAFTTYSVNKSIQSSSQLSDIRDLYFPVLERVDANIVRLDKMQEHYLTAVMLGEQDMVDQAAEVHAKADKIFQEMLKLNPGRAADIVKLRTAAQQYKDLATSVSADLLDKKEVDVSERTALMSKTLEALRTDIKAFRESSYSNFVQTLGNTQHSVKVNLYMGLALGLMNLCFMGVLVYFVRNNVKMISVIAEQNATLEHRVAERTAQLSQKTNDINAMLQNMKLGVCTVLPGNKIHPEYSGHMTVIFGNDQFSERDVMECLFASSTLGVDTKDQVHVALTAIIGEDAMMFGFNSHLLAREMQIQDEIGKHKILQMEWSAITNAEDIVDKVLLIVQDVTELRQLEMASAQQKEELDIIAQIIKISIGKFNEFIASAHQFIAENRKLIEDAGVAQSVPDPQRIAALFRNMHTIKGNARTYEFSFITNAAHAAEQMYDRLRKDPVAQWSSEQLLTELAAVDAAVARYVEVNEDKLGRKGRAADLLTTRGSFVGNEEIAALKTAVAAIAAQDASVDVRHLLKTVNQLGLIPLERLVSGAIDSLSSLAKELGKPTPTVQLVNGNIAFNNQFAQALKSCFMHIVRNSMDHGIEAPADRLQAHKPEQGQLCFTCQHTAERMELHISDDGRGLALHKLFEKGVASGLFEPSENPDPDAVAELIFHSGLSTATQLTQVSGRGVGMDAVRSFLKEQGSDIRIVLDQRNPVLGFTPFKFVIGLPPTVYG